MFFRFILKHIVYFLFKLVCQVKIIGKENIPKEGGALVCPNHIHYLDGPLLFVAIKRQCNIMSKAESFKPIFLGWLLRTMGCIPVDRSKKDFSSLKKCVTLLKQEQLVGIFPEGTRNGLAKGKKLGRGTAFLLMATKMPLIPVGISGKYRPFGKLTIKFGEPVTFEEFYGEKANNDIYEEINQKILVNIQNQLTN